MVLSDLCRPGRDRGLLRLILEALRDFDVIHKKDLGIAAYGMVDLEKLKIYVKKYEGYENDDTFLHELRHIFRNLYSRIDDLEEEGHERDAAIGAVDWHKTIYKDLEK